MIRTLLVDDEYPSLKILENFTLKLSECEVVAKCSNAAEAIAVLEKEKGGPTFSGYTDAGYDGYRDAAETACQTCDDHHHGQS
jgi:hypothetical protein